MACDDTKSQDEVIISDFPKNLSDIGIRLKNSALSIVEYKCNQSSNIVFNNDSSPKESFEFRLPINFLSNNFGSNTIIQQQSIGIYSCFICGIVLRGEDSACFYLKSQKLFHMQISLLDLLSDILGANIVTETDTIETCSRCSELINEADSVFSHLKKLKTQFVHLFNENRKPKLTMQVLPKQGEVIQDITTTTKPPKVNLDDLIATRPRRGRTLKRKQDKPPTPVEVKKEPVNKKKKGGRPRKPFGCYICRRKFLYKDILTSHLYKEHGIKNVDNIFAYEKDLSSVSNPSRVNSDFAISQGNGNVDSSCEEEKVFEDFVSSENFLKSDDLTAEQVLSLTTSKLKRADNDELINLHDSSDNSEKSNSNSNFVNTFNSKSLNEHSTQNKELDNGNHPSLIFSKENEHNLCLKSEDEVVVNLNTRKSIHKSNTLSTVRPIQPKPQAVIQKASDGSVLFFLSPVESVASVIKLSPGYLGMGASSTNCDLCGKKFTSASSCTLHKLTKHGYKRKKMCNSPDNEHYSISITESSEQLSQYATSLPYKSELASQSKLLHFVTKETKSSQKDNLHECDQCSKIFNYKYELERHKETHVPYLQSGPHEFDCCICGLKVASKAALKIHLHRFHSKKDDTKNLLFLCSECGFMASSKKSFTDHQRVHNKDVGLPKVTCNHCQKELLASSYKMHLIRMHGEAKHPCQTCGQKFTVRSDLMRHINTVHSTCKPYDCEVCGKKFITSDALRYHRNKTHSTVTYYCSYCSKSSKCKSELRSHVHNIHLNQKERHCCTFCSKSFTDKQKLSLHMTSKHAAHVDDFRSNSYCEWNDDEEKEDISVTSPNYEPQGSFFSASETQNSQTSVLYSSLNSPLEGSPSSQVVLQPSLYGHSIENSDEPHCSVSHVENGVIVSVGNHFMASSEALQGSQSHSLLLTPTQSSSHHSPVHQHSTNLDEAMCILPYVPSVSESCQIQTV